jgi:hypothetical protein
MVSYDKIVGIQTEPEVKKECEHEWKRFKQTVRPERTDLQNEKGYVYKGSGAYFVVRACEKCKEKQYIDYKVLR